MEEKIFDYFKVLSSIPRCSGNEDKVVEYLAEWAKEHNFEYVADEHKNIAIYVKAPGNVHKSFALQCHTDMVCEKNLASNHNFLTDPIRLIRDEDFIKADGTSLGADNGIGMAIALSVAEDEDILNHTGLELVFTSDEETGLNGAKHLAPGLVKSSCIINLDSESENEIIIGCAGGVDLVANRKFSLKNPLLKNSYKLTLDGLTGGHSGVDIHKKRLNAIRELADLLNSIGDIELCEFAGGTRHNAIPRSACAVFNSEKSEDDIIKITGDYKEKINIPEPSASLVLEKIDVEDTKVLQSVESDKLIKMLLLVPDGVDEIFDSQVVTSSNFAILNFKKGVADILISIRSSYKDKKDIYADRLSDILAKNDYFIQLKNEYSAWEPNFHSKLLNIAADKHFSVFGKQPEIKVIHAGLECGIILEKYPCLDAISVGPDIYDPHSPSEKVSISSTKRVYNWLKEILLS